MLRLSNKWIWIAVAAMLTPFLIVAGVTAVALGISARTRRSTVAATQHGPSAYAG